MLKKLAVVLTLVWTQQVYAHAWVANAPAWSRSYASASVPGSAQVVDSGVTFGQSAAAANAANANANASAAANSIGLWGGSATANAFGPGARAGGSDDPFPSPIVPVSGPGFADITFQSSYSSGMLDVWGTASHNANGYLELSVLNTAGLTPDQVSNVFLVDGSVQSALANNTLSTGQVLLDVRENQLNGSFNFDIAVGSINPNDLAVEGLAHAVSGPVPEPETTALLGVGLLGALLLGRRRSRS